MKSEIYEQIYSVTYEEYDRRCRVFGYVKGLSGLFTWLSAYEGLMLISFEEVMKICEENCNRLSEKYLTGGAE